MQVKLIPMVGFILEMRFLTTKEFCEKYRMPIPHWRGDKQLMVADMLRIDAIKFRMAGEYAKLLSSPFTIDLGKKIGLISNKQPTINHKGDREYSVECSKFDKIVESKSGRIFFLSNAPYDTILIKKVSDLLPFEVIVEIDSF